MGEDFAIDQLYATGWTALDTAGCTPDASGRWVPGRARIEQEFAAAGFSLLLRRPQLFDCSRAEWIDAKGVPAGSVVGKSDLEAAIYALAVFRRQMQEAGSGA